MIGKFNSLGLISLSQKKKRLAQYQFESTAIKRVNNSIQGRFIECKNIANEEHYTFEHITRSVSVITTSQLVLIFFLMGCTSVDTSRNILSDKYTAVIKVTKMKAHTSKLYSA